MGRGALVQVCTVGDLGVSLSPCGCPSYPVGGLCQAEPGGGGERENGTVGSEEEKISREGVGCRWPEALEPGGRTSGVGP